MQSIGTTPPYLDSGLKSPARIEGLGACGVFSLMQHHLGCIPALLGHASPASGHAPSSNAPRACGSLPEPDIAVALRG